MNIFKPKIIGLTMFKTSHLNIALFVFALLIWLHAQTAQAVPLLHNDHDDEALEAVHLDGTIPHYEYGEELERGEIEQEIEYEIYELLDIEQDILEQELETHNDNGEDVNPRTNFLSNDDHGDQNYQTNIFSGSNDFYYFHQLPPGVNPDVPGNPQFNDFDFTAYLIEFEFELEGWTDDPSGSTFEVRIMDGEVFGVDSSNMLTLTTFGDDVGILGTIEDFETEDGRYEFEFEFEQYGEYAGYDTFISPELYQAIDDGILGIHIVRTSGNAGLYLEESEVEFEQPASMSAPSTTAVPEPATIALLGIGLAGLAGAAVRKKWKKKMVGKSHTTI